MDRNSGLWIQINFSGESKCDAFHPHSLKADYCIDCMLLIGKHRKDAIADDKQIMAAFEYTQKGATVPSGIIDRGEGLGALYLGGYRCVMELPPSVKYVVNTAQGLEVFGPKYVNRKKEIIAAGLAEFLELEWMDQPGQNIIPDLERAILFIEKGRLKGGDVLVHCAQGKSRSGSVVVAYCMVKFDTLSFDQVFAYVKSKRAMTEPNEGFMAQLKAFAESPVLVELRAKLARLRE